MGVIRVLRSRKPRQVDRCLIRSDCGRAGLRGALGIAVAVIFVAEIAFGQSTSAPAPREIDPYLAQQLTSTMKFLLLSTMLLLVFFIGAYLILRFGRAVKKRSAKGAAPTAYIDAWAHYRISQEEIDRLTADESSGDGETPDDVEPPQPRSPDPS